jgi:membrane protease YdiL (CAAX protease family)
MSETRRNTFFARLGAPQVAPPWSLWDVVQTYLVLLMGVILIGSTLGLTLFNDQTSPLSILFGWAIGLIITGAFVMFVHRRDDAGRAAMRLVEPNMPIPLILLLGVAAAFTIDVIVGLGGGDFRPVAALTNIGVDGRDWLLAGLFIVAIQPVVESLVFFGVSLPRFRSTFTPWGGLVVTVALFTSFHVLIYGAQLEGQSLIWYGLILPILQGLFLAIVRIRTQSTSAVIATYVAMGITALLVAFALA